MFERVTKRECVRESGNELISIRLCYPRSEKYPGISEFYEKLTDNARKGCIGRYQAEIKRDFDVAREEKRAFAKLSYFLECKVAFECEGLAVIALRARLLRGREAVFEYFETQWWELCAERMIPPRLALREYAEWQKDFRKLRRKSEAFVKNEGVFSRFGKKERFLGELVEKVNKI